MYVIERVDEGFGTFGQPADPIPFAERRSQALADLDAQMRQVLHDLRRPSPCGSEEANRRHVEALATFVSQSAAEDVQARFVSCHQRFYQARFDAIVLQTQLLAIHMNVLVAQNDDQLEGAYVSATPPEELRAILLRRFDRVLAIYTEDGGWITEGLSALPDVGEPLLVLRTATQQYRNRVVAASTSLELMRLWREYESVAQTSLHVFDERLANAELRGPLEGAAAALSYVADKIAGVLGVVLGAVTRGLGTIFWELFKTLLPVLVVAGVGWYGWTHRERLFGVKVKPKSMPQLSPKGSA